MSMQPAVKPDFRITFRFYAPHLFGLSDAKRFQWLAGEVLAPIIKHEREEIENTLKHRTAISEAFASAKEADIVVFEYFQQTLTVVRTPEPGIVELSFAFKNDDIAYNLPLNGKHNWGYRSVMEKVFKPLLYGLSRQMNNIVRIEPEDEADHYFRLDELVMGINQRLQAMVDEEIEAMFGPKDTEQ
jgi:hypothetical protein